MIFHPPIVVVYIDPYYIVNDTDMWIFMLLILDVLMERGNKLGVGMGTSTLSLNSPLVIHIDYESSIGRSCTYMTLW
jgi:hypothetical protein